VHWLEEQLEKPPSQSIINYNLHCVKKDAVINQINSTLEDCPDVALDAVVQIIQKLSDNQKTEVIRTLSQLGSVENVD
jgi:acetyl-CoA carboxylase/biotin carboxylase 1